MNKRQQKDLSRTGRSVLRLHILGAGRQVTGSMYLFEFHEKDKVTRFVTDLGLTVENQQADFQKRLPSGINASDIDFAIISHAHVDHSAYLPKLIKDGFKGAVYVTPATRDLMGVILPDSGYLQEEEAKRKNARYDKANAPADATSAAGPALKVNLKSKSSKGKNPRAASKNAISAAPEKAAPRFVPLYTQEEAQASLKTLRTVDYDQRCAVTDSIAFTFTEAGHILGAAVVNLEIGTGSQKRTFCFSGNIGRPDMPLLRDLQSVNAADYVMVEATYGNRLHQKRDRLDVLEAKLLAAHARAKAPAKAAGKSKKDTAGSAKLYQGSGVILIPAFAVGRAQALLNDIRILMEAGRVPVMPVYVDGRMTQAATEVHRKHVGILNDETRALCEAGVDPYTTPRHAVVEDWKASEALHREHSEPTIIVSSSGMASGGRIVNHLNYWLGDSKCTVMFVGYQGTGTLGQAIVRTSAGERPDSVPAANANFDTPKTVRIAGKPVRLNATVDFLPDYSAHADYGDTVRWLGKFKRRPKMTFIVHGDEEALAGLQGHIESTLDWKGVTIPTNRQVFEL
ncbi:MAG: MBL fold metallo-hydrolase [Candidatus Obscuribacterales bacterium]|jgi:metallo-beta-lactamase family protein